MKRLYRYIISFAFLSYLLSTCPITFTENFFNDDIIGYYLSAIDINTGESNVLLFDYALEFGSDCDLPNDIDIKFKFSPLNQILNGFYKSIEDKMMNAFEKRASKILEKDL